MPGTLHRGLQRAAVRRRARPAHFRLRAGATAFRRKAFICYATPRREAGRYTVDGTREGRYFRVFASREQAILIVAFALSHRIIAASAAAHARHGRSSFPPPKAALHAGSESQLWHRQPTANQRPHLPLLPRRFSQSIVISAARH